MLESTLVSLGFLLIVPGVILVVTPLKWLGPGTRRMGAAAVAAGVFLEFAAGQMLDSFLVYFGLVIALAALVSLIRPIAFLFLENRRRGLLAVAGGLALLGVALILPVGGDKTAENKTTKLDEWMPRWQVGERHVTQIAAAPEEVFAAIRAVSADDIFLFRTLIAIRRCGQDGPESILNAPDKKPLLDVATQTSFVRLAEEPPREIVIGTVVAAPRGLRKSVGGLSPDFFRVKLPPGVALATMNFFVQPDNRGGSILSSETRIDANSPSALRSFVVYWRIIHPGSDIIRRMWLRAIKQRAERPHGTGT